jgi:hypothetical protein
MSGNLAAHLPANLPPAPTSADALAPDPSRGSGRPKTIVLATVLGWNALGLITLWALGAVAARLHPQVAGEDWTGVLVGIVVVFTSIVIMTSAAIEVAVAVARARKPGRLPANTSTGRAIAIGSHTAAWALCVILPYPCWILINALIYGAG